MKLTSVIISLLISSSAFAGGVWEPLSKAKSIGVAEVLLMGNEAPMDMVMYTVQEIAKKFIITNDCKQSVQVRQKALAEADSMIDELRMAAEQKQFGSDDDRIYAIAKELQARSLVASAEGFLGQLLGKCN